MQELMSGGNVETWDWEYFEALVTNQTFSITDCGPLYGPVTSFSLTRDENLELTLETKSELNSTTSLTPLPTGTVYHATDQVKFESRFGSTGIAQGVIPHSWNESRGPSAPQGVRREISSVHVFEWHTRIADEPHYIIEWLENIPEGFIWPDTIETKSTGKIQRIFKSQEAEIAFSTPIDSREWRRACVHISVEGVDLFIGTSKNIKAENINRPGFILYKGNPNEKLRARIRDCISFSLGTYCIYLGNTCFNENSEPISFKAVSAYSLDKNNENLKEMPPTPLGQKFEREVSAELLERMVASLCTNYDAYNFQSIFWSYWHAVAAPVHMSAVHFGAAIEALQRLHFSNSASPINKLVLDKVSWDTLAQKLSELEEAISILDAPQEEIKILSNKLKKLNDAPQNIVMNRFLEELNLQIGEIEKSALKNRNRAAHGGSVNEENSLKIIRENKALRVLINRIMLAIVNGSNYYYDYYTLGRPISLLEAPISKP